MIGDGLQKGEDLLDFITENLLLESVKIGKNLLVKLTLLHFIHYCSLFRKYYCEV